MSDLLGKRPLTKVNPGQQGLKTAIDENREVSGFLTDDGIVFIFTSHGISTQMALSVEALAAALGIADSLLTHNVLLAKRNEP